MSDFLHTRVFLDQGEIAVLDCDTQCNFILLDDHNFQIYKNRGQFTYYGQYFTYFPARIAAPFSGYWNTVIYTDGPATIKHSLTFITR